MSRMNLSKFSVDQTFDEIKEEIRNMVIVNLDKHIKEKYNKFNKLLDKLKKYIVLSDLVDAVDSKADMNLVNSINESIVPVSVFQSLSSNVKLTNEMLRQMALIQSLTINNLYP